MTKSLVQYVQNTQLENQINTLSPPTVTRIPIQRYNVNIAKVAPKRLKNTLLEEYDKCFLGISLGNPNLEDTRFEACVEWISENFSECALVVGDYLYRFTLQIIRDEPPESLKKEALRIGNNFKDKYNSIIKKYSNSCNFQWLPISSVVQKNANVETYLVFYRDLYQNNLKFQMLVDEFSTIYLERIALKHETDTEINRQCAIDYLIEEIAVFTDLYEQGWSALIYPGSIKIFEEIAEGVLGAAIPPALQKLIFVSLNLNKSKKMYFDDQHILSPNANLSGFFPKEKVFNLLNEQMLWRLQTYTSTRLIKKGEILTKSEYENLNIYIIQDGTVEFLKNTAQQQMEQILIAGAGSVIGMPKLIKSQFHQYTISALENCNVLIINQKGFGRMKVKDASLALVLMEEIARFFAFRLGRTDC